MRAAVADSCQSAIQPFKYVFMKITEIDFIMLSSPYRLPDRLRSYGVATVRTEDGRIGVGEPYAGVNLPTVCREAVHILWPLFDGKDATDIATVMQQAYAVVEYYDHQGMLESLLGAIDWALHDLASQRAGLPLHRYLNPQSASDVEIYASTGIVALSHAELADEMQLRIDEGYRTIKIRVGCGREDVRAAIARAQVAARAVEGKARLGVDAGQQIFLHNRWSRDDAKLINRELGRLGVCFFEDPLLIWDFDGYRELCDMDGAPIAGGEMFNRVGDFQNLFNAGAVKVAQPDACVLPGPGKALEVVRDAHRRGLRVALHGWAGPVAQMQNVHVALAAGACEMVEYCPLLHPLLVDGVAPSWKFENGRLAASTQPGMGTAPIDDLARKYPFANVSSMIA